MPDRSGHGDPALGHAYGHAHAHECAAAVQFEVEPALEGVGDRLDQLADLLQFLFADRDAGPVGLLQVLEACGALLVAMVRTTPLRVRAHHASGVSDPEGFAAMGAVETLVHTHDVAEGFGLAWTPPSALCSRVLARLFPEAPASADPWLTLLWATGRAELPGHPRLTTWRWDSTLRS
ncbi:hypothetical protein ACFXKC_45170 [Streptomyces sp. NPDC059340]|uniref:hypothetical protein n=1 Tax=Streptomyces sp. NPDC059340 TaxID=3346806 RepID=UPI0036987934